MMRKKLEMSDEKLLDCSWASTVLAMHLKHRKHLCTGVLSLMFPISSMGTSEISNSFFFIRFFFQTKCLPIEIAILRQCLTNSLIFFQSPSLSSSSLLSWQRDLHLTLLLSPFKNYIFTVPLSAFSSFSSHWSGKPFLRETISYTWSSELFSDFLSDFFHLTVFKSLQQIHLFFSSTIAI